MSLTACITNISRGSLHDGPGVRTVVYLKGCGLRCAWCHNPETFHSSPLLLYAPGKCIHCGRCVFLCPECHKIDKDQMVYLREHCTVCGRCADACPSGALTLCGEEMDVEAVLRQVRKDAHFYIESGGGITLSGGECLLYPEFCRQLLMKCRQEGIGTAVESALFVPFAHVESVAPLVDIFFADVKLPDAARHRLYTGQDNHRILDNLQRLTNMHKNVILRIPLIPGVNDSLSDMDAFADVISPLGNGVRGVELLRYNYLASGKYALAGMKYRSFGHKSQSTAQMDALCTRLCQRLHGELPVYYRK